MFQKNALTYDVTNSTVETESSFCNIYDTRSIFIKIEKANSLIFTSFVDMFIEMYISEEPKSWNQTINYLKGNLCQTD